jgi:Icc-related predicted phosphoesterase
MRICHASDWHGEWHSLPGADLYVFTGDMLPNFITVLFETDAGTIAKWHTNREIVGLPEQRQPRGFFVGRKVDRDTEKEMQLRWLERTGGLRQFLGNWSAPVVIVRGNHDFCDMGHAFDKDFWEVTEDPTRTTDVYGWRIGGCRGITPIDGEWSDETPDPDFYERIDRVPRDLDMLVTHSPPLGILDGVPYFDQCHYGSSAVLRYVHARMYEEGSRLRAHLFGHMHDASGKREEGNVLFSNAATTFNVLELDDKRPPGKEVET